MQAKTSTTPGNGPLAAIVVAGFGTTVALWAVGYFGRLPALSLPSPLLLALFLMVLFAGGVLLGRYGGAGAGSGAPAGLISGLLNLLILGSLLTGERPNEIVPSALWWIPGSILVSAGLVAAGAWAGASRWPAERRFEHWRTAFPIVAVAATMLLLAVGGLVTSANAGLAVTDWPASFGYNMFLYPFSRMTGNVYYEHAHRLFGALVGLTTLALAIFLQRVDSRPWVRRTGWVAFVLVVVQGMLGGLRVTGRFTTSTSAADMEPSLALALVHGVLGQIFFATLVALAAFSSSTWRRERTAVESRGAGADRVAGGLLIAAILVQLTLGASQRHFNAGLVVHLLVGIALVAPLAVHSGMRAWSIEGAPRLLRRLGLLMVAAISFQLVLGFGAWVATQGAESGFLPVAFDLLIATFHQWFGALLLGLAVLLSAWNVRWVVAGDAQGAEVTRNPSIPVSR